MDYQSHIAFNGPLATGLRSLCILNACEGRGVDIQTLVALDYLVVHSGDEGGPVSLHPPIPQRVGELAVRQPLIERGLVLMELKGLIKREFDKTGVSYRVTDRTSVVLEALEADYTKDMRHRADWAVKFATERSGIYLKVIDEALDRWNSQLSSLTHVPQVT